MDRTLLFTQHGQGSALISDAALVRFHEPVRHLQEGALSRAVGTADHGDTTLRDSQVKTAQQIATPFRWQAVVEIDPWGLSRASQTSIFE